LNKLLFPLILHAAHCRNN